MILSYAMELYLLAVFFAAGYGLKTYLANRYLRTIVRTLSPPSSPTVVTPISVAADIFKVVDTPPKAPDQPRVVVPKGLELPAMAAEPDELSVHLGMLADHLESYASKSEVSIRREATIVAKEIRKKLS
jgi:hypothetical protein